MNIWHQISTMKLNDWELPHTKFCSIHQSDETIGEIWAAVTSRSDAYISQRCHYDIDCDIGHYSTQLYQLPNCTWRCLTRLHKLLRPFFFPSLTFFIFHETNTNCMNITLGYEINHVIWGFTSGSSIIWRHFRHVIVTRNTINLMIVVVRWHLDWNVCVRLYCCDTWSQFVLGFTPHTVEWQFWALFSQV
jgi:hypothetical protein